MGKQCYIHECLRQLNDTKFFISKLDNVFTKFNNAGYCLCPTYVFFSEYIDKKLQRFLVQSQAKPGRFYILPKLHKAGNPGRVL